MTTRSKILFATAFAVSVVAGAEAAMTVFQVRWRVQFVVTKAIGRAPYMSWQQVFDVLAGSKEREQRARGDAGGSSTEAIVAEGHELFRHQCAQCHGVEARGGIGPDLAHGQFQHGGSDDDLRRTITEGIPGTPMQPRSFAPDDVDRIIAFLRSAIAAEAARTADSSALAATAPLHVGYEDLAAAARNPDGWLMYSGSYDGQRHSRLAQITRANVARLRLEWMFQIPKQSVHEAETTPIVADGAMFVTIPPNHVWALDARTGREIWSWSGPVPKVIKASNYANRGVAISGNALFLGTLDAHLVALNAQTGAVLWDVQVADPEAGYSITSAPLAIRDQVIVGVAGGEFGIRGFLDAYSAETGKRLWRFHTVPEPGRPGSDTWGAGDAWKEGGCPTWLTGSYDPALNLIYWGVGNPGPDFIGDVRPGRNLYSNSVIALDAATGQMRWYFQFTPHDEHDWDAAQIPVLADAVFDGKLRRLMLFANRNAFYYVLDRETGRFLRARPFATQNWAERIDENGDPVERADQRPTTEGVITWPSVHGATNWWSPSYDPASGTIYVPVMEGPGVFTKGAPVINADGSFRGSSGADDPGQPLRTAVRALEATTGALRWEYRFPPRGPQMSLGGVLSTDGGLVFAGDLDRFVALDSRNGHELWHFGVGAHINAAPIAYQREGRQRIALAAGRVIATFSLDEP